MKANTKSVPILSFVCILCLAVAGPSWSATYYVDVNSGTDDPAFGSGPGAIAWKTLHYAVTQLQAGDTLNVAAGAYRIDSDNPGNGETDAAITITKDNITIQGTTGTVLDGYPGCTNWGSAFNINASGVTIRNLEITGFSCDVSDAGIRVGSGSNNRIESCTIHNNDFGIVFEDGSGNTNAAMDSLIYENDHGIIVSGASPEIRRNSIYENRVPIEVTNYSGTIRPKIINNLIYGFVYMEYGIWIGAVSTGATVAAEIYHNTIYGSTTNGIYISQESPNPSEKIRVKFNIVSNSFIGIEIAGQTSSILDLAYNNLHGNDTSYSGVSPGANDVALDPKFVDPTGSDYHLQTTSQLLELIGAGAGDTVATDREGGIRPTGTGAEMGCYEFGSLSGNNPPDPPVIDGPLDESAISKGVPILLDSGAYHDPDGDEHLQSHWKVWRADNGETIYEATSAIEKEQALLPETLAPGLKYEWQVAYEDSINKISWSQVYSFKVGDPVSEILPMIKAGKNLGDFGMISIVHWPDNPAPQAVFNINYDPKNYRIGTWDPGQGKYIEFGQGLEIEPGRTYWILTRDDLAVNFSGIPVSRVHDLEVCLHTHPSTGAGWNMIAPPNATNYLWNDVLVGRWLGENHKDNVSPVAVSNPVASTLISHRIYEWQGGKYKDHRLDEDFVLAYYKGYWVKALVEGAYLEFPVSAQVNGLSTPRNTMLAWKGKAVQWMKNLLPTPDEAIADDDLPPMPMGGFEDSVEPVFEGCFIESANAFR